MTDNPNEDNPNEDNPNEGNPNEGNPNEDNPNEDNPNEDSSAAVQTITQLFAEALGRPTTDFAVDSETATRLIEKRLFSLRHFTTASNPSDLRQRYDTAVKMTELCDRMAKMLATDVDRITSLPQYSDAQMYAVARSNLDRERNDYEGIDAKTAGIRDDVLLAIYNGPSEPAASATIGDIIRARFAGRPAEDLITAGLEATLLVAGQNLLKTQYGLLKTGAFLGFFCRGMFYRSIVEGEGSRLARQAARERFQEKLSDVPIAILSVLPVIGEFIDKIKLMADLIMSLALKEYALAQMQQHLADAYKMASEFVDTYILAVQAWFEWANGLQSFLFKILHEHSEKFSESAFNATFEKIHRRRNPQHPGQTDGDRDNPEE